MWFYQYRAGPTVSLNAVSRIQTQGARACLGQAGATVQQRLSVRGDAAVLRAAPQARVVQTSQSLITSVPSGGLNLNNSGARRGFFSSRENPKIGRAHV